MGQKPDDWHSVSLCKGCHQAQHTKGERTFWDAFNRESGLTYLDMINAFCKASPCAQEISKIRAERNNP